MSQATAASLRRVCLNGFDNSQLWTSWGVSHTCNFPVINLSLGNWPSRAPIADQEGPVCLVTPGFS